MRPPNGLAMWPADALAFFLGFLRDPVGVGSVIPSSRFLERRIVDAAGASSARVVVELGPGTGGTTRALLAAMPADARLVCIEIDPKFADHVARLGDPRLIVRCCSAEHIGDVLAEHDLRPPDAVVSGIPFSTMPPDAAQLIARRVHDALPPGGCFVAYQFKSAVAGFAAPVFGEHDLSIREWRNIPPMRLWRWRRR
jgi:phosphatidylethanolamine/phosphatidyl-N-methylethanolamine N-methyltransferase